MFLHSSVCTDKFKNDKKLNMLKNNTLTLGQFLSLIDINDPYIIIGNAIVDKNCQKEFLDEWKSGKKDLVSIDEQRQYFKSITLQEIMDNLHIIMDNYPEFEQLYSEFFRVLQDTTCKPCTKNKYIFAIIKNIHDIYKDDKREISEKDRDFIIKAIKKYYPIDDLKNGIINLDNDLNKFDLEWIPSNIEYGLGYDLIEGLTHCFECVKKHLSRAKILFEEMQTGYPDYKNMMFNEFTEANKNIEEAYSLYWDSIGNLDQAACELVGQVTDMPTVHQIDLVELANTIRISRLKFQEDITKVPNWNQLRVEVQRIQNKINKELNK